MSWNPAAIIQESRNLPNPPTPNEIQNEFDLLKFKAKKGQLIDEQDIKLAARLRIITK